MLAAENSILENPRSRLQYPLVWLLTAMMMLGPIAVLRQTGELRYWNTATAIALIAAAWGVASTRFLSLLPLWQRNGLRYRAAEVVVISLLLRLLLWFQYGFPSPDVWRELLVQPWLIFDGRWWGYVIIALWAWYWSGMLTDLFNKLEISDRELRYYRRSLRERRERLDSSPLRGNRSRIATEINRMWLYGGLLLVFFAGSATYQVTELSSVNWISELRRLPMPPLLLLALLLYLFIGLWMMTYSRYTVMFARWMSSNTNPQPQIASRWRRSSLLLLLAVGVTAAFLPIGSSVPIAIVLQYAIWLLLSLVMLLARALFVFMLQLLALFSPDEQEPVDTDRFNPMVLEQFNPTAAGDRILIPPEVTGGLTWITIAVVVVASLLFLLRQQGYGQIGQFVGAVWQRLRSWWLALRQEVGSRVEQIRADINLRRRARPDDAQRRVRPLFRINALPPREQIRYFYISTVQRAGERGVARAPSQTPGEFLEDLRSNWPETAPDSEQLTDAFLHARYSADQVDDASRVKRTWKRVRQTLRRQTPESKKKLDDGKGSA